MMGHVGWTEGRVEQLTNLWTEGLSCSQIASAMGGVVTRSAVIGKVHRLGLPARAYSTSRRCGPSQPKPHSRAQRAAVAAVSTEVLAPLVLEDGSQVTIHTVSARTCRWPIGDPLLEDFHFCGHPPKVGAPYCAGHCAIAYTPQTKQPTRQDRRSGERHALPLKRSAWA